MIEYREYPLELRSASRNVISGFAARYGVESHDLGGFREIISYGAFNRALETSDAKALLEHDQDQFLGCQSDGSLTLWDSVGGLAFVLRLSDTPLGNETFSRVASGDLATCSFAFGDVKDDWRRNAFGVLRTISSIGRLLDISLVKAPAYPRTSVSVGGKPILRYAPRPPDLLEEKLRLLEVSLAPAYMEKHE
jgi:HK97 family phage prohead protease